MDIKELSFMQNLSDNGKEISAKDSIVGGDSYGYSHILEGIVIDFDFGSIVIEVTEPEPEPEPEPTIRTFAQYNATGLLPER